MNRIRPDRIIVIAAALGLTVIVTAIAGRLAASAHYHQTELLLLTQQLGQGSALVAAESKGLLRDSQALVAMQQVNDRNIAAYQLLTQGSVKRNLPALTDLLDSVPVSLDVSFNAFQGAVTDLIQSRRVLEQVLQGKDDLIQSTERLAAQAENLADGLEQQNGEIPHMRAAYRIQAALIAHTQAVQQAYDSNGSAPALSVDQLRSDLAALSTDSSAPQSPTIRRTAANLLNQLETHLQQLNALRTHNEASQKLAKVQDVLQQNARTLQQQLETVTGDLYGYTPFMLYLTVLLSFISLILAGTVGYHLRKSTVSALAQTEAAELPMANPERTTPNFLSQFKTEKNLLMNDIKPIGEGILYIKADEHLESTGDLARCLNHSRENLIRRIDQLKRHVADLQNALDTADTGESPVVIQSDANSADKARLIDLTFKGHAELDGLQRLLKAQPGLDREQAKQLLLRCIKTDRLLDEIRVRLKKSGGENDRSINDSGSDKESPHKTVQLQKVTTLVSQLMEHLEEFQTQPGKSRRSRGVTP